MSTTLRNFRADDDLWSAFQAKCRERKTNASEVIRELIREWLKSA